MFRRLTIFTLALSLCASGAAFAAAKNGGSSNGTKDNESQAGSEARQEQVDRAQQKREAIDEMASMTMDRLLSESPQAKRLFGKSVGYAVFDNLKMAFLVSGGGGVGVAVERATREKTYMKMGTAGIGIGVEIGRAHV